MSDPCLARRFCLIIRVIIIIFKESPLPGLRVAEGVHSHSSQGHYSWGPTLISALWVIAIILYHLKSAKNKFTGYRIATENKINLPGCNSLIISLLFVCVEWLYFVYICPLGVCTIFFMRLRNRLKYYCNKQVCSSLFCNILGPFENLYVNI